jgi:hypothetical protein
MFFFVFFSYFFFFSPPPLFIFFFSFSFFFFFFFFCLFFFFFFWGGSTSWCSGGTTKRVPTLEMSEADWEAGDGHQHHRHVPQLARSSAASWSGAWVGAHHRPSAVVVVRRVARRWRRMFASKSAVAGLTRALAVEWAPHGVNVNANRAGLFRTDLNTALLRPPRGQEFKMRTR